MTTLLIRSPLGDVRRQRVEADTLSIGRAQGSDITIVDPSVSRLHARLVRHDGSLTIVDAGSRNGTVVNERRIAAPTPVYPGDRILLGDVELELVDDKPASIRMSNAAFQPSPDATQVLRRGDASDDLSVLEDSARSTAVSDTAKLLTFFEAVTQAVIEQRPFEDVLEAIVLHSLEIMAEADRACLILVDDETLTPRIARQRGGQEVTMDVSQTIVQRVYESQDALLSVNAQEDQRLKATESVFAHGICSVMCVPMIAQNQVLGALYLDTLSSLKQFTFDQLRIFAALGNIAAGHLERQQLMQETMRRQVLVEQMKAAALTQARLLQVELPEVDGYAFHVANRPCLEVGGDYVDIIPTEHGLILVLADVCGKGIDAAILMATLKAGVNAHSGIHADVQAVAERVNAFLVEHTATDKFATMFLARLDPASGVLDYVNAGHDPPVIARASGTIDRLDSTGVMVGAFRSPPLDSGRALLEAGDLLAVYTDGFHEIANPAGEQFSEERLVQWIAAHRADPLATFAVSLEATVLEFAEGAKQQDDMTQLLAARRG